MKFERLAEFCLTEVGLVCCRVQVSDAWARFLNPNAQRSRLVRKCIRKNEESPIPILFGPQLRIWLRNGGKPTRQPPKTLRLPRVLIDNR